ncbi:MAG: thrombospondin type 3 repeat-containing protein, partial [Candidatus Poseidoniaceae archaeon]|nr:thrombospondin type 3 repeat-containing protein [Candidatus Poseidoniaceae archaeon]
LALVDENGCSSSQLDDDNDLIFNDEDVCPATPSGEAPDAEGCSASQLDDDGDTISNADDLCPMTNPDPSLDADGCVSSQRDSDNDGVLDNRDDCPETNMTSVADDDGCALEQIDSDQDGYNDRIDAFPLDEKEWQDSDGDGVPNKQDAYPDDPSQTMAEAESGGSGFLIYTLVAILVLGALAGLGMMRRNNILGVEGVSPFSQNPAAQGQMETQMLEQQSTDTTEPTPANQEWEENGVRWLRQDDGSLFYLDPQANQWVAYEQPQ